MHLKITSVIWVVLLTLFSSLTCSALDWQEDVDNIFSAPITLEPVKTVGFLAILGLAATNDNFFRDLARDSQSVSNDNAFETITAFGHGGIDLAIAGSLALAGEEEAAYKSVNAIAYAGAATMILKNVVGRPRPYTNSVENEPLSFSGANSSFPSGHTATAFALASVLAEEYPKYKYLFYGGAVLVGISRIYLDMHYASDVVAGAAIGLYSGSHVQANSHLFEVKF